MFHVSTVCLLVTMLVLAEVVHAHVGCFSEPMLMHGIAHTTNTNFEKESLLVAHMLAVDSDHSILAHMLQNVCVLHFGRTALKC